MSKMRDEIEKATAAHAFWKIRLRSAINRGEIDVAVADIARDDRCEFGKWLYSLTVPRDEKGSDHHATVRRLHADFHKAAARVAELAVARRKDEAALLLNGGDYTRLSDRLTQAMKAWGDAVP